MQWWPWRRQKNLISIGDPVLAGYFQLGNGNYTGVPVGEGTSLGVSAFYRAASLISGTIAMLPLTTIRNVDGATTQISSFLDDPGGVVDMTPFEWKQTVILHQLLHGQAFLAHVYNQAGSLAGLVPIHPLSVQIDPPPKVRDSSLAVPFSKTFTATLEDGSRRTFTPQTMTHCPALSVDGRRGLSLISLARNSLGIAVAADRSAAKLFSDGALISGLVTPEEDLTEDEAKVVKDSLNSKVAGWENAGSIAVVNRRLKFSPWTMSHEDAQWLQSRAFQIEEIARWTGVPPHLLAQTDKQTSWGTGVAEQNRGLSRYTLSHWTARLEQRLSRLLARPRSVRFDYSEWTKPSPETEIDLLIKQAGGPILTVNEARARLGLNPVDGGDVLGGVAPPAPVTAGEEVAV